MSSSQADGVHLPAEPGRFMELRLTAQQLEVVRERDVTGVREVLADGAAEEEDEDDGGRDPEGPVEVGVALEDIEEVGAGV